MKLDVLGLVKIHVPCSIRSVLWPASLPSLLKCIKGEFKPVCEDRILVMLCVDTRSLTISEIFCVFYEGLWLVPDKSFMSMKQQGQLSV